VNPLVVREPMEIPVTKGQIFVKYRDLSPHDQGTFRQWLRASLMANVLLAVAVVTVALYGSRIPSPSTMPATRAQTIPLQELHSLTNLDKLPVERIHNQALVFAAPAGEPRSVMASEGVKRRTDEAN
jgi:hypothetical protein